MVEQEEKQTLNEGNNKRKLDEEIEMAKQKAQQIAARILSDADSKRPRLFNDDLNFSKPTSLSNPPLPDVQKFPSHLISNSQVGSVPFATLPGQYQGLQGISKKISIPNGKVGVVIGRGGETIKYLQLQSGANIQITKDSDADPYSQTRDVELRGTLDQISRAEQLINDAITETDAGGSAPSASMQPGTEQFTMKVPNNKVSFLIGKGGETIRNIQGSSGARVQIIPLRLPPGDTSTERTVYINGLKEQIESAKELINEVIIGNRFRNMSGSSSYVQPVYTPAGNWGPPGQPPMQQQPGYGYTQTGPSPPPYYGGYPTQVASSDQSNPSAVPLPPHQGTGYNYYDQQAQTGSTPPNLAYSYSQTQPVASQSYDQGFSQQPPSYGQGISGQVPPLDQQKPYGSQGYGPSGAASQPDGTNPASPVFPLYYNQPVATAQAGYGTAPAYTCPPPAHPGYGQTSFIHPGYGGQQPVQVSPVASQPAYGQVGYPPQPAPAPATCAQGTIPPYGKPQLQPQPQSEPASNGISHPMVYGAEETGGRNLPSDYGSSPVLEVAHLES